MLNLVVVAHPDDEILGFGATGAKLALAGEIVQAVILCGHVGARALRPTDVELSEDILAASRVVGFSTPVMGSFPNIKMNTVPHLDIVRFIEDQIAIFQPDRIFTHHVGDLNDDHLQVARACLAAARYFQRRAQIKGPNSIHTMEIPSSTDWGFASTSHQYMPNLFVDIDTKCLELKIRALACYRKVMRDCPHPRSREGLTSLATFRGGQGGFRFAESFQTVFQRNF